MELLTPAFVGRDRELATVVDALAKPPAMVLVEGEAGIGKTRLVREALGSMAERTVLAAVCPPSAAPAPLGPIVNGLRQLRRQLADVTLTPLGGALRPLFPEWAGALPPVPEPLDDPTEVRHRLFAAIQELVDRLGVDLLVVEDAHWADPATLEFLLMLTTSGNPGMSIVVTYRPTDLPEASLLLRLTSRLPTDMGHARVGLEPLDVTATGRLVASMFATERVSDEFVTLLHSRTDGVPLALEESVLLLADRHDIRRRGSGWTRRAVEQLQVPPTVRDSVLERAERLDPDTRRVLEAAAVLAEPADHPLLAQVAGQNEQVSRRGLATALASGLLQETSPERFEFRHSLAARAIYEAIPVSDRRRLHRGAAQALETADPQPVAQLARHCREANDIAGWSRYAEAAADVAMASGEGRAAVALLLDVLTADEHPTDRRARLACKVGEAAVQGTAALGDMTDQVAQVLRAVLTDGKLSQGQRGEIRLLLGRLLLVLMDENDAAYAEIEAAIPDLDHQPALAARAMLYLAWPWTRDWPVSRHLRWLERATELAPEIASPAERLSFDANHATALLLLGDEAGWQAADRLPEPEPGMSRLERQYLTTGLLNVAEATVYWGRYAEARRRLRTAVELAEASGFERKLDIAAAVGAYLDWCTGAWEGLAETVAGLAGSQERKPVVRLQARLVRGLLDLARGDRAAAERGLGEVFDELARRDRLESSLVPSAPLARIHLADGAAADAVRVTDHDMDVITRKGLWGWATDIAPVRVEALIAADRVGEAEALVDQFAAWVADRTAPAPAAGLSTCRAILAEDSDEPGVVASLFADAATAWAGLPRPYDELLAIERQGRCLLAADKTDEALTLLTDAEQRLAELGARFDADRIAHLLRSHGIEVKRAWRGGRRGYGDQLSPRELEVVRLVATGLTNPQVGEQLFLSPKTVAQHLSAAMRKLDVSSRTALVMAASEAGLLKHDRTQASD